MVLRDASPAAASPAAADDEDDEAKPREQQRGAIEHRGTRRNNIDDALRIGPQQSSCSAKVTVCAGGTIPRSRVVALAGSRRVAASRGQCSEFTQPFSEESLNVH